MSHFEQEYRLRCKNKEYKWVHDFTRVVRNSSNIITHYYGYIYDITDLKLAEQRLKESKAKQKPDKRDAGRK